MRASLLNLEDDANVRRNYSRQDVEAIYRVSINRLSLRESARRGTMR